MTNQNLLDPKSVPLTDFRIHLNLIARERAISFNTLKLWQLTEHAALA